MHDLGGGAGIDGGAHDQAVKAGIVLLADCSRCGRQWKGIIKWAEVAMYEMKRHDPSKFDQRVEHPTRQGLLIALPCNGSFCNKPFKCMIEWDELRRWIDIGVQSGSLDPRIKRLGRR